MSSINSAIPVTPPAFLSFTIDNYIQTPSDTYERIYQALPKTFLYESGAPGGLNRTKSLMGSFKKLSIKIFENHVKIEQGGKTVRKNDSPEMVLDTFIKNTFNTKASGEQLHGGVVGYLGYDSLVYLEDISLRRGKSGDTPLSYLGLTDEVIVIDHTKNQLDIFVSVFEGDNTEERILRLEFLKDKVASASTQCLEKDFFAGPPISGLGQEDFSAMVEKAKKYIHDGDIFQANLSQQFKAEFDGSAWGFYLALTEINPSPFQGYINFGDLELVSGSPERLIKIDSGEIETRPIAGTRPRGQDPEEDRNLSRELLLNEKERAEHIMLVDLERNDLGRVCQYGSVTVKEFMGLEPYSHVWHIVSSVTGLLKEKTSLMDVIKSCFPGGTITGCPKVRCMEIIEELENISRGIYTGSMGYFGWGGKVDLNILIRSAVIIHGEIRFSGGAGIVADSLPEAEYKETVSKVTAIMEALGHSPRKNRGAL